MIRECDCETVKDSITMVGPLIIGPTTRFDFLSLLCKIDAVEDGCTFVLREQSHMSTMNDGFGHE